MFKPVRFDKGVSTAKKGEPFANFGLPNPLMYHSFFDDFDNYIAANWTLTETQAGATQALADGDGGRLLLTNSAADDDVCSLQKVGESFRFDSTKALFMATRFMVSDATQSDILIGLAITDTSPIASVPTDGIHLLKTDGAATIIGKSGLNSAYASSGTIATLADATFVEIAMVYEGKATSRLGVTYYDFDCYVKNSAGLWTNPTTVQALAANICEDEDLTPTICLQNGEAVAKTLTIDYLMVCKER